MSKKRVEEYELPQKEFDEDEAASLNIRVNALHRRLLEIRAVLVSAYECLAGGIEGMDRDTLMELKDGADFCTMLRECEKRVEEIELISRAFRDTIG